MTQPIINIDERETREPTREVEFAPRPNNSPTEPNIRPYNQEHVKRVSDVVEAILQARERKDKDKKKPTAAEFAKEFLLNIDKRDDELGKLAEKYQQSKREKVAKQGAALLKKFVDVGEALNPWNKRVETMTYEAVYGGYLDKQVAEYAKANFTGGDRKKMYQRAVEVGDQFMAETFLLSVAQAGDLNEGDINEYFKQFCPAKDRKNVDFTLADGQTVTYKNYPLGNKHMVWFETKMRREALITGKRPDLYKNGLRKFKWEPVGLIAGVELKDATDVASSCEDMTVGIHGRGKADVALDIHTNIFLDEDAAEALKKMLERQLREVTQLTDEEKKDSIVQSSNVNVRIERYRTELQDKRTELKDTEAMRDKLRAIVTDEELAARLTTLEQEISRLKLEEQVFQKRYDDEADRKRLMRERLAVGIKDKDFKTFLVDDFCMDSVEVNGKEYFGMDLAINEGARKYYAVRSEQDVDTLLYGQHVKIIEQMTLQELMGDKYRTEFFWNNNHWLHGAQRKIEDVSLNDDSRNIAVNATNIMREKSMIGGRAHEFTLRARGLYVDFIDKQKRVVVHDKEKHDSYWVDPEIVDPNDNESFNKFTYAEYLKWRDSLDAEQLEKHLVHEHEAIGYENHPLIDRFIQNADDINLLIAELGKWGAEKNDEQTFANLFFKIKQSLQTRIKTIGADQELFADIDYQSDSEEEDFVGQAHNLSNLLQAPLVEIISTRNNDRPFTQGELERAAGKIRLDSPIVNTLVSRINDRINLYTSALRAVDQVEERIRTEWEKIPAEKSAEKLRGEAKKINEFLRYKLLIKNTDDAEKSISDDDKTKVSELLGETVTESTVAQVRARLDNRLLAICLELGEHYQPPPKDQPKKKR